MYSYYFAKNSSKTKKSDCLVSKYQSILKFLFSENIFYFRKNSLDMDMDSMMEDYGSYMETVRKFNIPCYM